eukprot:CAMPEP_0169443350 /NCGR_PEP_ID=MMETSP1042-20121227/9308_1 /TAXON_ID=464988 /ORGANISM="Hemiselmis andersenii, Strain CCMP1180" /LENGTH=683 /DNA_ID=CAMNT_0009554571 /DNA_START=182 /DNA_END=2229 /DNA_ORIENTATION=+
MPRAAGRRARGEYQPVNNMKRFPDTLACVCLVFEMDEEESAGVGAVSITQQIRQPLVDKLRAADLIVRETCSRDRDEMFVIVSASEKRQKQVAEVMGKRGLLSLRLRQVDHDANEEKNEGALCPFKAHLTPLYEWSSEGTLFSSYHQTQILEYILNDEDERVMGPQLVQKEVLDPGNTPLDQLVKDGKVKAFFRMHHQSKREELTRKWVMAWHNKQPIEDIREYFGEKIALYFAWLGYYTTMLWIPALCGLVLTVAQAWSHHTTGSMDNPWVPLYCCFTAIWGIVFTAGWKRLELAYQYEWDTKAYEETEEERREFIQHPHTRESHCEYKDEDERFPDPFYRSLALCVSAFVVCTFITAVVLVVSAIASFKYRLMQTFEPMGIAPVAKGIGGVMQALSIMIFNRIYQVVLKWLTANENWRTPTEYEDATIAKDFSFKFVNAYFACFFVAFVQNNVTVYGVDMHCPEWHCMPELTVTLACVFAVQMTVVQTIEVGVPVLKAKHREWAEEQEMRKKMGENAVIVPMSEEEKQSKMEPYDGVFEEYQEMVIQFGYVTLFAAAFPLTAALALLNNCIEIRTDAYKLLQATQRPKHRSCADIGTWGSILDIITTAAILTNCALVGFTSHGLFFYLPDLTPVERVWVTVMIEHALLLFKVVLETILTEAPAEAVSAYERRCFLRDKVLA